MNSASNHKSNENAEPDPPANVPPAKKRIRRLLVRIAVIVTVVVFVTVALHLWQERVLGEASAALERGDAKYAHYLLEGFLNRHPGHQRAMALQAHTFVALGLPDKAIVLFDQIGAADVEDVHAWGRALMMKSQWSRALPLLNRVLDVEPDEPDALYETAACQVRLGRLADALVNAEKLAENPAQAARGYVFVGTILGDLGNHDKAAETFAEVLKHEPTAENLQVTRDEFFLQYGRTFLFLGKPDEAVERLKRSVAIRETPDAFVLLGDAALQLGESEKAAQAWKKAIQLQPLNEKAREGLANIALQNGQPDEALKWLKPLEQFSDVPYSTGYLFERTHTQLKNEDEIKKWREITAKQRRIEELNNDINVLFLESPDSFWARVIRAHRFAAAGNWSEAELLLKRLLKEAPAETFVIELADAVFRRTKLPSIEKLPIDHF
ncbi:MAG TPA: tetratricopeptide repeat protein [Pirellulaceae bacterium]|jgi:tetratricopeptide (TPR) repeat protein|nr:tetratricopeptide repeat protein [Pirellulaceae bacterium]